VCCGACIWWGAWGHCLVAYELRQGCASSAAARGMGMWCVIPGVHEVRCMRPKCDYVILLWLCWQLHMACDRVHVTGCM
jgi:hypothetical protein